MPASPTALRADVSRPQLRVWFAVVVMLLASLAQALHSHGRVAAPTGWQEHAPAVSATEASGDTCPLCVAMHSAAAAPPPAEVAAGIEVPQPAPVADVQTAVRWPSGFAQFSRPPPVS